MTIMLVLLLLMLMVLMIFQFNILKTKFYGNLYTSSLLFVYLFILLFYFLLFVRVFWLQFYDHETSKSISLHLVRLQQVSFTLTTPKYTHLLFIGLSFWLSFDLSLF